MLDCKTAVFFANASDRPYSNERLERVKKRRGRMARDGNFSMGSTGFFSKWVFIRIENLKHKSNLNVSRDEVEGNIEKTLFPSGPVIKCLILTTTMVNKIDRPNTTPTVRVMPFINKSKATKRPFIAVYFSVFRPFCCFTLVYEGHFVLCYKEKTRAVRTC